MKKFTSESQKIGEIGEDIACKWLENKGFTIIERNYTKKWGEIDIIANKEGITYFIEVKSVSCVTLPDLKDEKSNRKRPEENMHPQKLRRLSKVIQTYLINRKNLENNWQFDLLIVFLNIKDRMARVGRIENIVL